VTGAVSNSSASARRPAQVWSDAARLTGRIAVTLDSATGRARGLGRRARRGLAMGRSVAC
jgi:hypothetical protein